jgi:hypothetical protein
MPYSGKWLYVEILTFYALIVSSILYLAFAFVLRLRLFMPDKY